MPTREISPAFYRTPLRPTPERKGVGYCELVLSLSNYPDFVEKECELTYVATTKILVVDYSLPAPDKMPTVQEVKYVKASQRFVEVYLPASEREEMYDNALYQICLRTIYELFDADVINGLEAVVFNGWVRSVDKSIGKEVNSCVISIQVLKREFQEINLANVDPKACFKKLKGVASALIAARSKARGPSARRRTATAM